MYIAQEFTHYNHADFFHLRKAALRNFCNMLMLMLMLGPTGVLNLLPPRGNWDAKLNFQDTRTQ